jgi:CheY-like chemotaxis protein
MSGEDGLRSASLSPPDLILLDMFLPRLDGMMVLRMLNSDPKTRGIPIVVLSGNPKKEDIDQAKKLGAVDYFVKDAMPAERLVALIKQVASVQSLGDLGRRN